MLATIVCFALQAPLDQSKIDRAVDEGARYLLGRLRAGTLNGRPTGRTGGGPGDDDLLKDEIVLYTLIHAPVDEQDEEFAKLLKGILESKLESVYRVALQAMALEALDATKYQGRIAQCGQFLIDNQCGNGQWSYGKEVPPDAWTPSGKKGSGTQSRPRIGLKKRRSGPSSGDNSNSQYALLGLRACMMSDVVIPTEVFTKAEQWWLQSQTQDGGWDYDMQRVRSEHSYGAMTAGGASSLAVCKFFLKKDRRNDPAIQRALAWLAKTFSVTAHPRFDWDTPRHGWKYYWLYALERAGMLCELEKLGSHEWYPAGARFLLEAQGRDGAWDGDRDKITNTCFAILFLRRATKPLKPVATGEGKRR
ncbi:MAG: terpene cyclase/mutase family protein [Planctomycetes bacterium]|nr:terpene cyclase/mutase family protein [Planctomycetota bacterium]